MPGRTRKRQIVLHHTASPGESVLGDIAWWIKTSERVATFCIVDHHGTIHQLYSSTEWAHHLGVTGRHNDLRGDLRKYKTFANNLKLNKAAIGIEIDSAGGLRQRGEKWFTWYGAEIKESNVVMYPNGFRGYEGFEKYTEAQLIAVYRLVKHLSKYHSINVQYSDRIWDVCEEALSGVSGLFTHVSYRTDKSDCHPQQELIDMLKQL